MKWQGRNKSSNVERSSREGRRRGFAPAGKFGGVGLVLAIVVALITGQNPLDAVLGTVSPPSQRMESRYESRNKEEAEIEEFLSVVLKDTEDVWTGIFDDHGAKYRMPKLRLYQDTVNTGCGFANSRMGPFYCGADERVYIDVSFIHELRTTFKAEGDFPFAYVLAHEVGHHVQKLTGKLQEVQGLRGRVSDKDFNNEMVKLELQADYYAGVVAHHMEKKGYLDPGDVDEGMAAAAGVGDDRIYEMAGKKANPDNFQHGRSDQRKRWFLKGYKYGDLEHGNTFSVKDSKDL